MTFPIYEKILFDKENIYDTQENTEMFSENQKEVFLSKIKSSKEHHELCYAIIKQYQLHNDVHISPIPYGGKEFKKGFRFDFNNFPLDLQKILYIFAKTFT